MSVDPYHAVQQEIQSSLQTATQLQSSFLRIQSMARPGSEELMWARNELKATLASLEADLEDLEESVKIVESTDARMFGLDDAEVQNRRRASQLVPLSQFLPISIPPFSSFFVIFTNHHPPSQVQNMRATVSSSNPPNPSVPQSQSQSQYLPSGAMSPRAGAGPGSPFSERYGANEDHQAAWAREEQQMMIREQDQTMDSIAGTLTNIAQQASLMGQEINEHNEMLTDLERGVDQSDSKLSDGMRRMRKFLRDSEEKGSSWCIVILMIVLMALLLAVILV
ncbi:unnamed protein product [Cyclocybe aegerita]|uniref:t-SNARE coiled-coil homology domain-containing protein n=1 Tax=Cyclocybe aegerita TaxID=1973307 RepID=A0A8S0VYQ3_CYCAE|nr:unnamed protein product [Cyclocybe aegerita]